MALGEVWRSKTGFLKAVKKATLCHYVTEIEAYAPRFTQTHWLGECVYRIGDWSVVERA